MRDSSGNPLFKTIYNPIGLTQNFSLYNSINLAKDKKVHYDNSVYDIESTGLSLISRDQGTGYHIPEGIFLASGASEKLLKSAQKPFLTNKIHDLIFELFTLT